jgi:hypothetical protein
MATDLTTVFGSEIKVYAQPRIIQRQYAGYPGTHGLTGMHMGSRGYIVMVTGKLAVTGNTYALARAAMRTVILAIEEYLWADSDDYSFGNDTYENVVFEKFELVPDNEGKAFHITSEGYLVANFIALLRALI